MKLKNFFLSCSSGSRSKRLREEQRKYENLRPLQLPSHQHRHNNSTLDNNSEECVGVVDVDDSFPANSSSSSNVRSGNKSKSGSSSNNSGGGNRNISSGSYSSSSSSGFGSSSASAKVKKSKNHNHRQQKTLWSHNNSHQEKNRSRNNSSRNSSPSASRFYVDCPSADSASSVRNYENLSSSSPEEIGVKIGDRIIWLREAPYPNEAGRVKWKGVINNEEIAGIEFDRGLGLGSGWYRNHQLFTCQPNHGGLVAVAGLILEDDYNFSPGRENLFATSDKGSSPSPSPSSNSSASIEIEPFQSNIDIVGASGPVRSPQVYYQGSISHQIHSNDKGPSPPKGAVPTREQLLERLHRTPGLYGLYDDSHFDTVDYKKNPVRKEISNSSASSSSASHHSGGSPNFSASPAKRETEETLREVRFVSTSADWEKSSLELESRLRTVVKLNSEFGERTENNTIPKPDFSDFAVGDGDVDRKWQLQQQPNHFSRQSDSVPRKQEGYKMPTLPFVQAPLKEEDVERINGRAKGIQGHRNSCYLDATLFSMFSFTGVFDSILLQDYNWHNKDGGDEDLARQVQRILRDEIVTPLRKNMYCTANNVMKLRETMQHLDDKLTAEEMDPQEFLQLLFSKVLHLEEFMSLSSGQSDFFHQVLVQQTEDDKSKIPTIQQLFEQSLIMQDLKLKSTPVPALILQMPRSGNKYKMYDGILPNLTIDITDLMENTPRTCIICGGLATYECPQCYGKFDSGGGARDCSIPQVSSGAESTAFCETCLQQSHMRKRQSHASSFVRIKYSFDTSYYFPDPNNPISNQHRNGHPFGASDLYPPHHNPTQISNLPLNGALGGVFNGHSRNPNSPVIPFHAVPSTTIPRVTMDLFAVICIETSHFVSFVKCGTDRKAPWVFFDSMADRVENPNGTGHNVPQVKMLPKMGVWLEQLEGDPNAVKKRWDGMPPELRRLLSDPYICLYYSPQSSMYS